MGEIYQKGVAVGENSFHRFSFACDHISLLVFLLAALNARFVFISLPLARQGKLQGLF